MKKVIIITLYALIISLGASAQIKPEVFETVELMSILSRTAGFQEYCMDMGGVYTEETETWFSPFKEHSTVAYFKDLRTKYNIGYDAVMTLAINLTIDYGKIIVLTDKEKLGPRWKNVEMSTLLDMLNLFYNDTRFHDFFQQHQAFYLKVLQTYESNVMKFFHQNWYSKFYGTDPTERFRVVIGFTCGGGNYGPSRQLPGQPKEAFAICGYYIDKQTGIVFENGIDYASTLIHEFNHSFVNGLLENEPNKSMMNPIGKKLLKHSYRAMNVQAYRNAETVINESIVRAAVILYMQDNGFTAEQVKEEMDEQISRGFNWMPELVTTLRCYLNHRGKYPTLNDYYPQIAKTLDKYINAENRRISKAITK